MSKKLLALIFWFTLAPQSHAEVSIEPNYHKTVMNQQVSVNPRKWAAYWFETKAAGPIRIEAEAFGDRNTKGTVFVCDKVSFHSFKNGRKNECRGLINQTGKLSFSYIAPRPGSYFIVADNRKSMFSKNKYLLKVQVPAQFSKQEHSDLRKAFEDIENFVKREFKAPDFAFRMRPCGYVNAFSDTRTGDITICTETLIDASQLRSVGQITGILLHELGHTLLNFWGNPNYANEETADAFATYLLLTAGGREMIEEFAKSFERGDPWAEAKHIITTGDTHQISIQRARTIRQNAERGKRFTSRWNKTVYPNLTDYGLRMVIRSPSHHDEPWLAQEILNKR